MNKDRVIKGYDITTFDFQRFSNMGVTPYVYVSNDRGSSDLVEVDKKNYVKFVRNRVYLLTPDEYAKTKEYVDSLNHLIELQVRRNALLMEMVPGIIVEKIMKD